MRPERLAAAFMQYSSKFIANPSNLRLGRLRYAAERAIYRGPSGQGGRSGGLPRPDDALPATALALCTALAVAAAVLLPPYPPLQDFIEWIYQAEILAQLPSEAWPPGVHVATYPVPNSLFQLVLTALALAVPALAAGKLFLIAYTAAAAALAWGLARRYQPGTTLAVTAVLLVSFCFNTPFWDGYANYQTGLLIFMAWLLLPEKRQASPALILLFGIATFFAHAMAFVAFAILVGLQALTDRRLHATMLALAPSLLLAAWYVLGKDLPDVGGQEATVPYVAVKAYTLTKLGPYHNFVFETGGDAALRPILYGVGISLNLLYTAGLLAAVGWGLWISIRRRALPMAPVLAALLLGALFLRLPQQGSAEVNPGEQLACPALLLLLLFLPLPRQLTQLLGTSVLVLLISLATLAAGPQPWWSAVSPAGPHALTTASQVLFWHRPTAFVCKWQEVQRLAGGQEAARIPITFQTSLLVGAGGQECNPG